MIPLIPMPYHERRSRRGTPHGFENIWKACAWSVLAWLVVLAVGYGIEAIMGDGP